MYDQPTNDDAPKTNPPADSHYTRANTDSPQDKSDCRPPASTSADYGSGGPGVVMVIIFLLLMLGGACCGGIR